MNELSLIKKQNEKRKTIIINYRKHENDLNSENNNIKVKLIYLEKENNILKNKISEYKRKYVEETINYKNEVREIKTFGKNKSKYLINLTFKVTLINTEFNEIFFVSSFSKDSVFFHTNNPEEKENICYIITNKYLFIQNFTPNAVSYLGLTSSILNNDVEITFFIKQFYEDFLNISIENEQLNSEQKLNLKKKILNKKYKIKQKNGTRSRYKAHGRTRASK